MDDLNEYLDSDAFRLFQDKSLRLHACHLVNKLCDKNSARDFMDKAQLYSIPTVIQAGGMNGFSKLIRRQVEKNSNKKNKEFWSFISSHLSTGSQDSESLNIFIRNELSSFLEDELSAGDDKKQRNHIKKQNRQKVDQALEQMLPIFFEHFNCHYFYFAAQRKQE